MSDEIPKNPTLEVKDGGFPSRTEAPGILKTLFDTKGNNFLGSGLSFADWSRTADYLRYERSFVTQTPEEQRRRMHYIVKLSAEQERILEIELFATLWSESVIRGIIEGDWKAVKMWTESLLFLEESEHIRNIAAPRFAKFVEIAREAYDTRPTVFCPVCRKAPPQEKIKSWEDGRHVCPFCSIVFDDEGNFQDKARARLKPVDGGL